MSFGGLLAGVSGDLLCRFQIALLAGVCGSCLAKLSRGLTHCNQFCLFGFFAGFPHSPVRGWIWQDSVHCAWFISADRDYAHLAEHPWSQLTGQIEIVKLRKVMRAGRFMRHEVQSQVQPQSTGFARSSGCSYWQPQ